LNIQKKTGTLILGAIIGKGIIMFVISIRIVGPIVWH